MHYLHRRLPVKVSWYLLSINYRLFSNQVQKSVSLKYQCCMSCGEVSTDNLENAQLLSQNEVLLEQTSTEVTVKIYQITDQMACETFSQKDHSKTHEAECDDAEDIKSAEPNDYETTTFMPFCSALKMVVR